MPLPRGSEWTMVSRRVSSHSSRSLALVGLSSLTVLVNDGHLRRPRISPLDEIVPLPRNPNIGPGHRNLRSRPGWVAWLGRRRRAARPEDAPRAWHLSG